MIPTFLTRPRNFLLAALIIFFSVFAFWLRILPMLMSGNTDIVSMIGSDDPFYNLRQVEVILANFPGYAWFDPMSNYPVGTNIYWGPLFPGIISVCCLAVGAATRPEIIATGLLVPPLLAAGLVVMMYWVGKSFGSWKTGLFASGFTAVVSGQYFAVSLYGYMDHHIAEVFFSTLFCLLYCYAILSVSGCRIDLKDFTTYKKTAILSALTGIGYLLGLFVMPTMILFAMIAGIFTLIQIIIDFYRGRQTEYLVLINTIVFSIAIIGLLLFGLKSPGIDLSTYSAGHILAYLGLIGGTWVLYGLTRLLNNRPKYYFPAALAGIAVIFALFLYGVIPQLFNLFFNAFFQFFGQQAITETVLEAQGWSVGSAWSTFNFGLILFFGGMLVLLYNNIRHEHPHEVFALVWSVVMFLSTWQHIRYEYYLAINIALLSAVLMVFVIERGGNDIVRLASGFTARDPASVKTNPAVPDQPGKNPERKSRKKAAKVKPDYALIVLVLAAAVIALLFVYSSVSISYLSATNEPFRMNPDWNESLDWLGSNTPETGLDYSTIYAKDTFHYPASSYGVMSWWDYGHMITTLAHRIPNANPFQQGVTGPNGSAAYFVTTSESTADAILDADGTRYVMTDIEMDYGKFPAMATWYNSTLKETPYWMTLFVPDSATSTSVHSNTLNAAAYYHTQISRLHNFDGSMVKAGTVYYIEYSDPSVTGLSLPLVTRAESLNSTEAASRVGQYNSKAMTGTHATVLSPTLLDPVDDIPALQHYRLIHESPTNTLNSNSLNLKYVKTFEYVKGAHIRGDGIIELPLITNTGRNFTYRQESIDGEFIVPYSTTGNPYGVKAAGQYRITGTGTEFDVPESAVIGGLDIQ
jgi:dolichyl-diphosphooligosaccharide--protein glycosyltransferase